MKKTKLFGSVTYDYCEQLPSGFEGYKFSLNGNSYFIPLQQIGIKGEKYKVMKHQISTCGIHHNLTDTYFGANTLAEVKRLAKYAL